jgi:hypothetical protein
MKTFEFKKMLPLQNEVMLPFIELIERERIIKKSIEEICLGKKSAFPMNENLRINKGKEEIVMIGGRPFAIICATVVVGHDYVEREIAKLADQLDKLALNAPGAMALKYHLNAADTTEIIDDAAYVRFYATKHTDGASYEKRWTLKGEELLFGTGIAVSDWPTGIDVVTGAPTPVAPGIVARYREKAQRIKSFKSIYTTGDGEYLGIEAGHSTIDPSVAKPFLRIELVAGGHPEIKYVKSIYQGIELQKNWSDGKGMVGLDKPTKSSYTDESTLPPIGASALWGYQAIFLLNDKRTGSFCDVFWVTVKGV